MIFNISSTSSAYRSHRNCILYSVSAKDTLKCFYFVFTLLFVGNYVPLQPNI